MEGTGLVGLTQEMGSSVGGLLATRVTDPQGLITGKWVPSWAKNDLLSMHPGAFLTLTWHLQGCLGPKQLLTCEKRFSQ